MWVDKEVISVEMNGVDLWTSKKRSAVSPAYPIYTLVRGRDIASQPARILNLEIH